MTIAARQRQAAAGEGPHHMRSRSYFQEGLEQQQQALLHLDIGVLGDHP
jgi:hypothetical protein